MTTSRVGADIRRECGHPIIDCDGHTLEHFPTFLEYVREIAGLRALEFYTQAPSWYAETETVRRENRTVRPPWWTLPAQNTIDFATATSPALLQERMEEFGIDYTVLFPTFSMGAEEVPGVEMSDIRVGSCRAYNVYQAERYRAHKSAMTPAARIPMYTPHEAVDEIRYAAGVLGMKVVVLTGPIRRPLPGPGSKIWVDNLGLDSPYDYDPVWRACQEMGVLPCFHGHSSGWGSRVSISNYVYNHIGKFATANEAVCKGLFMGGVTRRFPGLKVAFLEGGVGWALNLLNDLVSHWEKRGGDHVLSYDPDTIDWSLVERLIGKYETGRGRALASPLAGPDTIPARFRVQRADVEPLDDFARVGISSVEEFRDQFVDRFFFGCEADDRMNALAFRPELNPLGCNLKAVFSSDIGHWDVPDMSKVVVEAYELVEAGLMDTDAFKKFTCDYPLDLLSHCGPEFFAGSALADHVVHAVR